MSELKAISGLEIREDIDYNTKGVDPEDKEWRNYGKELCDTLYYRKSEADKYIGELKKERDWLSKDRAQAYDDLEKRAQLNIKQDESIRHQKYKRCLDKAAMCEARYDEEDAKVNGCGASWEYISRKMIYWERWRWRWDTLAELLKDA